MFALPRTSVLWLTGLMAAIGLALAVSSVSLAQQVWIRAYESEEDLWESFQEGEITPAQYEELITLFRAGADSVFLPATDIRQLPGNSHLDSLPHGLSHQRPAISSPTIRCGYTAPLDGEHGDEGYLIGRWQTGGRGLFFDARSSEGQLTGFRRRGITFTASTLGIRVTLGNFEPRFGMGLIVGRRDRVLGRTKMTELPGNIWQPTYSRYNGVFVSGQVHRDAQGSIFLSRIESSQFREDIAGIHLNTEGSGKFTLGVTGVGIKYRDHVSGDSRSQSALGADVNARFGEWRIESEIALAGKRMGGFAGRLIRPRGRTRLALTAWSYDPAFHLTTSGGPAHPARSEIELLPNALSYRSRLAGEQGFAIDLRSRMRTMSLESSLEVVSERIDDIKRLGGKLACVWRPSDQFAGSVYSRGRQRLAREADDRYLYFGLSGKSQRERSHACGIRLEYGHHSDDGTRDEESLRIDGQLQYYIHPHLLVGVRYRFIDPDLALGSDAYSYLYLSEKIVAGTRLQIEGIAVLKRYEDRSKTGYTDVRIRMSFRP